MNKVLNKFDFVLVILQCLGVQSVFAGLYRLYVAYHAEEWDALLGESSNTFESLTDVRLGAFFANHLYWKMIIALVFIVLIILINRAYNVGVINTVIVVIMTMYLSRVVFFASYYLDWKTRYYGQMLNESTTTMYLITGLFFLFLGFWLLYKSIVLNLSSRRQ